MGDTEIRQISFRCDQETYDQIHRERERCRVSLKDFILQTIRQRLEAADQIRNAAPGGNVMSEVKFMARPEEETMIRVLLDYIRNVPARKFDLTLETLALDAEHYRSSRLTGTRYAGRYGIDDDAVLAKLKPRRKKTKSPTK